MNKQDIGKCYSIRTAYDLNYVNGGDNPAASNSLYMLRGLRGIIFAEFGVLKGDDSDYVVLYIAVYNNFDTGRFWHRVDSIIKQ